MRQLDLFENEFIHKAPNVASVPQYSPLRYPGGKTWLYPFVKSWLSNKKNNFLIEPFAGGASVGLAAAIEGWVEHVILADLDANIFCFWDAVLNGHGEWLAEKVIRFEFTEKNVISALDNESNSIQDRAFALLLNNRISHGGIMALGAGRIKNGENGKGLKSRWYPDTLHRRIMKIVKHRRRISILNDDAFTLISKYSNDEKAIFFLDPPYTKAGKRLYKYSDIEHEKLFQAAQDIQGDFLITYDYSPEIVDYVKRYNFFMEKILMQTTHLTKKYELLITDKQNCI